MAQAELKEQGYVQLADILGRRQPEPQTAVGTASTLGQWVLLVFLVAMDVYLAVTQL